MMEVSNQKLTNLQAELLKLYSFDVSEQELMELKKVLSEFFAKKAADEMDRLWDKNDWNNHTMMTWLGKS